MKKITVIFSTIFIFLVNFDFAFAEFSYEPLSPLPNTTVDGKVTGLGGYITGLYKIIIGIAIILAVLSFIFAGLEWMTSEAVGKKTDAIKKINAALFGLLLTLGSWLFLNTINPATVNFNLNMDNVNVVGAFKPTLSGWYCKNDDGYYSKPYRTADECAATGCENCIHIGAVIDDGGSGTGVTTSYITEGNYFDTTVSIYKNCPTYSKSVAGTDLLKCKIIYQKGSGWYFNVFSIEAGGVGGLIGPNTESTCNTLRDAKMKTETVLTHCYNVELGENDNILNKMLKDEFENDIRTKIIGANINNSACTKVGETGCTNVGGLYFTVIDSINSLGKACDAWVAKEKIGTDCDIRLTAGTEWWPHGGGIKDIKENKTEHKPTFFKPELGRDVDISSSGTTKTIFTQYIIKHTKQICSGSKDITSEKTMDPNKTKTNITYLEDLGLGQTFNPGDMVKFCLGGSDEAPEGMFRFELKTSPHWHVRFGSCGCSN